MSQNGERRAERRYLYEQQRGFCFWCRKKMLWLDPYPSDGKLPPTACTVDHVHSRLNPMRALSNPKVAACSACNKARNREELMRFRSEHLRRSREGVDGFNAPFRYLVLAGL